MKIFEQFDFGKKEASCLINSFHDEMAKGLKKEKSSLKMLSSFVKCPTGDEKGRFLAVDLGGTNFRVMAVELCGARKFNILAVSRYAIAKDIMEGKGGLLFDFIAASIDSFLTEKNLPKTSKYGLGFTFSFPVRQTGIKAGSLILWTKGFSASGVVGNDVVALLEKALKQRGVKCISIDALANDTVGTLMTKSYQMAGCDAGVILGTGTNACYPEKRENNGIIINIEWGNFDKFGRSIVDEKLDQGSVNKGAQFFEKAVSGMYLGEIFRLLLCGHPQFASRLICKPYSISSENLSQIVGDAFDFGSIGLDGISLDDISALKSIANMIFKRSARLAVSAIASIALWLDEPLDREHVVAIDGALFEKYPGYSDEMRAFLTEILGEKAKKISFEHAKDGSGVGAAIIAAVAAKEHIR